MTAMARWFGVQERGSTLPTELLAGVSTFLSLAYIFVVNPAILAEAGFDRDAVFFATVVASAAATLAMGLWARLPFVLAPGMEMNAYVAFFAVGSLGFDWRQALGAVFWSGVLFMILTVTRVREHIIAAIPARMKTGLSLSVGVFLALIAGKLAGVLRYEGVQLQGIGDPLAASALVLYAGLALVLALERWRVRGSVLLAICVASALCHVLGLVDPEPEVEAATGFTAAIGELDLSVLFEPRMLSVILVLFLVDFYGSVAKFIGLTQQTTLMASGRLPRMREALSIDGGATLLGAGLGTTSLTTYVESGVGIAAGGRTGLTAVTCGVLMAATFLLAPALSWVPVLATTGALVWVGLKLCPSVLELREYPWLDLLVMAIMQVVVVATFAIDRAMLAGFVAYIGVDVVRRRVPDPYLLASTALLIVGVVMQYG